MKSDSIIVVSDRRIGQVVPFLADDLVLFRKHKKGINSAFAGAFFEYGFWKITVEYRFFGLHKKIMAEKCQMEL